jgi:hypothetical protein
MSFKGAAMLGPGRGLARNGADHEHPRAGRRMIRFKDDEERARQLWERRSTSAAIAALASSSSPDRGARIAVGGHAPRPGAELELDDRGGSRPGGGELLALAGASPSSTWSRWRSHASRSRRPSSYPALTAFCRKHSIGHEPPKAGGPPKCLRLPASVHTGLLKAANADHRSMADVALIAIEKYLDALDNPHAGKR